jgi:hypothetical protein
MPSDLAAGYCGEKTVEAFLARVGSEYPHPSVSEGRRQLWLRRDLDQAMGLWSEERVLEDAADVL